MRSRLPAAAGGDFDLTPATESALDHLATAARAGDAAARNVLYDRLAFKIARFARASRVAYHLEPDEVTSEAFLVLADIVDEWLGTYFGRYFLLVYPWRLRQALRRAAGARFPRRLAADSLALVLDDDRAADLAGRLAELEAGLGPAERRLLRARVLDGATIAELAAATGLPRRTVQRRWRALVASLRLAWTEP